MTLDLPLIVTAIGGLGTAAFGLVDATKVFGGGVNHIGFRGIRAAVQQLTEPGQPANALSQKKILATLQSNWMNGTDLGGQKDVAKSLIKLNLRPRNACALAEATGVDPADLTAIATRIAAGTSLSSAESDIFARFDLIVAVLVGLLATPLAPIAKDVSSALAMAVNALQLVRK